MDINKCLDPDVCELGKKCIETEGTYECVPFTEISELFQISLPV